MGISRLKNIKKIRFKRMYVLLAGFVAMGIFMFQVSQGISYTTASQEDAYIQVQTPVFPLETTCLVISDSRQQTSRDGLEQLEQIFYDMKVGCEMLDLAERMPEDFTPYKTVVVNLIKLEALNGKIVQLCEWVKNGGKVMFAQTMEVDGTFQSMANKLGIREYSYANGMVDKINIDEDFMLGAGTYEIDDGYDSALIVSLMEKCKVYASTVDTYPIPLIWEVAYGEGKFVVNNFGICEKVTRGFYAASYSLLEDTCIYPVIDASIFYIDDFPSPVPEGDGQYIRMLYNMNVADFYANVWWPDMLTISEKYGIPFNGMIIENYEDEVEGELYTNKNTTRFAFFGDMLLNMGGDLGIHGYNHQPLCLEGVHYLEEDYNTWPSVEQMRKSIQEVINFSGNVFPDAEFTTYVPPSNILSAEGRSMLKTDFPQFRNIASIYFSGNNAYEQEFEVAADGMIEVPRIVSGCTLTNYMKLALVSELNMHYVNTHFLHPDDLLDPERGAALGWDRMKGDYVEYLDWLQAAAPRIRKLSASDGAGAVQRFYQTGVERTETEDEIHLKLSGFVDDAHFMMRVNKGQITAVSGAEIEELVGNLYLIHASESEIVLKKQS